MDLTNASECAADHCKDNVRKRKAALRRNYGSRALPVTRDSAPIKYIYIHHLSNSTTEVGYTFCTASFTSALYQGRMEGEEEGGG